MARYAFRLPDIGEGIAEAEIVAWHVAIGDRIAEDARLADMMTDKATVEMESPVAGVVVERAGDVGDKVAIGATLAVIETDGESEEAAAEEVEKPSLLQGRGLGEGADTAPSPVEVPLSPTLSPEGARWKKGVLASPAVRARARDLGVDLSQVQAEGDRVRHADLDAYLRYSAGQGYHVPGAPRARPDEIVKVIGMRRRIAENMAASKRAIPHFTYVEEIDVTALEAMRADLNANRGERPRLTMLPFLIVAVCRVLPHGAVHLGMATQTDAGLMVPVIRDAQDRNVWQLASEIARLADAARAGKVAPADLTGGTLTVTSLGPLGGIATTPIVNRPEVAIIGPNKIVERPVFDGDDIRRAKLMNLSISCDHRVVDGWDAASFVQALKALIETPVLLFAE